MTPFRRILVPTDFGEAAKHALELATALATKFESQITLLHVYTLPPEAYSEGLQWPVDELSRVAKVELDRALRDAKERYLKTEALLVSGEPWEQILEAAQKRDADLVVMGTHGRRGLSRLFLGSVAEKVVRLSPVPVLTVSSNEARKAKETNVAGRGVAAKR